MALGINTIKSLIKPAAQEPEVTLYYEGDAVTYYHFGLQDVVEGIIEFIDFKGEVFDWGYALIDGQVVDLNPYEMKGTPRAYIIGEKNGLAFGDYVEAWRLRPAGTFAEVK